MIVFIVIVIILALLTYLVKAPVVKKCYYNKVKAIGSIEKLYTNPGGFRVSKVKNKTGIELFDTYAIWYPSEIESESEKVYPIVIMVNGTGVAYYKYKAIFEQLATFRIIVIGNDEESSWTRESTSITL
ncbi:hypothetical protein, partial [Anaerosporobacter sp.]